MRKEVLMIALHAASADGDVSTIRLILQARADVDSRDANGETALMLASRASHPEEALRVLLDAGALKDVADNDDNTALVWANLAWARRSGTSAAGGRGRSQFEK